MEKKKSATKTLRKESHRQPNTGRGMFKLRKSGEMRKKG